jgi:hypothetical protein
MPFANDCAKHDQSAPDTSGLVFAARDENDNRFLDGILT